MTIPATPPPFFFLTGSSSIWFMAWEKDPGWLKSYLAVAGRGLGAALIPGGVSERLLEDHQA